MAAIKSKASIMEELQGTTYSARIAYAAKLGREQRANPALDTLVTDLRTHPKPEAITVDMDEGLTEVLKPQQRLTAKYYDEDQIAMFAVVAAQTPASVKVLEEELVSPCVIFNKLTAGELVKSKLTTDAKLIDLILKSNPAVRKHLLGACVRFRRQAVLDAVVEPLLKTQSITFVAPFLHGCSKTVVAKYLQDDEWLDHPALNMRHMARYHADILLARMRADVAAYAWYDRDSVYRTWVNRMSKCSSGAAGNPTKMGGTALAEFYLRSPEGSRGILNLWLELPVKRWLLSGGPPSREKDASDYNVSIHWGSFITPYLAHLIHVEPKLAARCCVTYTRMVHPGSIAWPMQDVLGYGGYSRRGATGAHDFGDYPYGFSYEVLRGYFAISTAASFWPAPYNSSAEHNVFQNIVPQVAKSCSPAQLVRLMVISNDIITRYKPWDGAVKYSRERFEMWRSMYQTYWHNLINNIAERTDKVKIDAQMQDPAISKRPAGKDFIGNYRKLLMDLCKSYCDFMVNEYVDTKQRDKKGPTNERRQLVHSWQQAERTVRSLPLHLKHQPAHLAYVVKRLFPWMFAGQDMDDEEWRRMMTDATRAIMHVMQKNFEEKNLTDAATYNTEIFTIAFDFLKAKPNTFRDNLYRLMHFARPNDRLRVYKLFGDQEMILLGQLSPELLVDLIKMTVEAARAHTIAADAEKNYEKITAMLKTLMAGDSMSPTVQDQLLRFQDVNNHNVRKELTKATDSNAAVERAAALETLFAASLTTCQGVHMTRTMKFLQTKIKNESAPNRAEMLRLLVKAAITYRNNYNDTGPGRSKHAQLYLMSPEHIELWSEMLKDALESQDFNDGVDKEVYPNLILCPMHVHPILKSFLEVSTQALTQASSLANHPVFDFGVELQWGVEVFRFGEARAAEQFVIDFGVQLRDRVRCKDFTMLPIGGEPQFVAGVIEAYKKRLGKRDPNFLQTRPQLLMNVFPIIGKVWQKIPALVEVLGKLVDALKACPNRDADGLLLLEKDDPIVELFMFLLNMHGKTWSTIPVLYDFVEVAMRSRVALSVLFDFWLPSRSKFEGTNKERGAARDECVTTLLRISKSAIHLRFVWRHLVRWRQDIIDEYLNSKRVYPGVFYVEFEERCKLGKRLTARERRSPKKNAVPTRSGYLTEDSDYMPMPTDPATAPKVELPLHKIMEREAKLQEIDAARNPDSEHYFTLLATWGLHRLTPRQSNMLAAIHAEQALNPDRSRVDQVKAIIRWTIMPTIQYKDVVDFLSEHEKPKDKSKKPMSINVVEALIKGVMQNDEPTAPLPYLLSPQFLGSDRARVAVYMINACIRYIGQNYLTKMLRMVLTGQRRTVLKVTAYKEVIRLLAGRPTDEHMKIIEHEWNREVLHRDVRIAILKCCIKFLDTPYGTDMAWRILTDAVTTKTEESEALIALVGAKPMHMGNQTLDLDGMATLPRMLQTLTEMANSKIPTAHCARYAKDILTPIANLPERTAEDDDLKALAVLVLPYWVDQLREDCIDLTQKAILDFNPKKLVNNKKDMQEIYCKRFKQYVSNLTFFHARTGGGRGSPADMFKPIMIGLCNEIARLGREPETKRGQRRALMYYAEQVYVMYSHDNSAAIAEPMEAMGDLFWEVLRRREVYQKAVNDSDYEGFLINFVSTGVRHAMLWPHRTELVLQLCRQLNQKCCSTYYCHKGMDILRRLFAITANKRNTIEEEKGAPSTPTYQYLCRRLAMMFVTDNYFYVQQGDSAQQEVIAFVPSVVETLGASGLCPSVDALVSELGQMVRAVTYAIDFGFTYRERERPPGPFTRKLVGNIFRAANDVCMSLFMGERDDCDHFTPACPPPVSELHSLIIREFAHHMLESYTNISVKGAPELVGVFLHNTVLHYSSAVSDKLFARAVRIVVKVVQQVESHDEVKASTTELSAATLHLMGAVVTGTLFNIAELDYANSSNLELKVTTKRPHGPNGKWRPTPGYSNLLMRAALAVLQTYPWFVAQRTDVATQYIVGILATNAQQLIETEAVRSTLFRVIVAAFSDARLDARTARPLFQDPEKVLAFIRSLTRSPLTGEPVSNFAANLALDVLCHFGAAMPADPVEGSPETVRKWRADFEAMLVEFCNTDEGELQRRAWAVVCSLNDFPRIKRSRWEPTPGQAPKFGDSMAVLKYKRELTRKQQKEAAAREAEEKKKKAEQALANIGKAPKSETKKTRVTIELEGPDATLEMVAFAWTWDNSAPGATTRYNIDVQ